nr:hypothetical protein [Tanacetum cinerariifolium]
MDDEPMWAAERVVAQTPGSTITIPEAANEFTIKGNSNSDTDKVMARMDAMTIKMDAQYKELQSRTKQSTPNLDDDDMPMSREEEAKFMQTFQTFIDLKTQLETVAKNHQASIQNLETKFDRLADKQSGRPSGSLPSNTQPNPRGGNAYQPSIDVIDEILEEDFDVLLYEGSKILHFIEGTLLEEEIFSEFSEFIAMTEDENSESESNTKEPPFERITINTDYNIKTSLEEPPMDLELKTFLIIWNMYS